jgi:phosphotransferase system enzyme I (PtsI)
MNRNGSLPDEQEQYESYCEAVQAMQGLPVTIRTVDVGADKPLDSMSIQELRHEHTLNPALGLRAIRWSLSEPDMFRQQLRAILRAAALGKVHVLVPMLAHLSEVLLTRQALELAAAELRSKGQAFGEVQLGAMIEVPAAALQIDSFLPHLDFVSLGTNDLVQYTLAIDRADESVAHLYDPWHPAVLHLIHKTISRAKAFGVEVSVCGEMAGDTGFTELLLAMGLRSFSMHPAQIAAVKQRVLRADAARLAVELDAVMSSPEPMVEAARLWSLGV